MFKLFGLWEGKRSRGVEPARSSGLSIALGLSVAAGALFMPPQARAWDSPVVATKEGSVQGVVTTKGVAEFLGIPYAEPPLGNLRWKPSKKHEPWSGVMKTQAFGPTCAQITTLGVFAGPANNNEDCLYLNVFTPNLDPSARLPVVFWIHGGGLVDGESNDYDASKLAADGKTVVVTINYRLSLIGWFAHPALDAEGHLFGDYGTLDQQLAMKWVQRNIAKFGGDKNNVTVGGQSSGASSTGSNVISPLAAGLFDRAIIESGSAYMTMTPLSTAETKGVNFAIKAGCGSGTDAATAKCLRGLSAAQIMALSGTTSANGPYIQGMILDGKIFPQGAVEAFSSGKYNHMPIMNGPVKDEGNFNIGITEYFSGPPQVPPTAADFTKFVTTVYSGNAGPGGSPPTYPAGTVAAVLAQYPVGSYATPQLAEDAVMTDPTACRIRYASQLLANQVPVYAYEFDYQKAPYYFPKMPGFVPLAAHTIDIQFLFPLYHGGPLGIQHPLNNKQENLSDQLVAAWTNFAWTGNPNGLGNSPWPVYQNNKPNQPGYLSEDIPLATLTDAQYSAAHKCDFWKTILLYN